MTNAEREKLFSVIRESSQKCANTLCEDCKYNHFTGGTQTCIDDRIIAAVKENFKEDK